VTAAIIDGAALAKRGRAGLADEVAGMLAAGRPRPGLAVILASDDAASAIYVRGKTVAASEVGVHSEQIDLPPGTTQARVVEEVARLNADPAIHGILVQLPLYPGMDEEEVIDAIDPRKDVDGLHPFNFGKLAEGAPTVLPCTPAGIMECLRSAGVEIRGRRAVIVGRSIRVGRPLASLLLLEDATVTVCHSRSGDLGRFTREADILVAAVGRAGLVTGDMVKPGAAVIDVGMNRRPSSVPGGRDRIVGDVDRASVEPVAGHLTPVPGGVGPMTIAMLLANTVRAARAG